MTTAIEDDEPRRTAQDIRRDIEGYHAEMREASKAGDREAYADALADLKAAQADEMALLKEKIAALPTHRTTTIEVRTTILKESA